MSAEYRFSLYDISYGGITFECDQGCGDYYEDPDFQQITRIFASCIDRVLKGNFFVLDEVRSRGEGRFAYVTGRSFNCPKLATQ